MKTWIRKLFGTTARKQHNRDAFRTRPQLEALEDRLVPSVTYHGGALLTHVEVQALYYGNDWHDNSTYFSQTGALENYLSSLVHGSYLTMLNKAGYGVGTGSFDAGKIGLVNIDLTQYLTDSQIRNALQGYIDSGALKSPDSNRLYVFFVEDNVAVMDSHGATSLKDFLGYHGAFAGHDVNGNAADIHYAVIPYAGGSVGNGVLPGRSVFDTITETTSHEVAEAATDPDVNYKQLGWYDDKLGEIGDICAHEAIRLNGSLVQRISDKNDQAMTPAGAAATVAESFVLRQDGTLYKHTGAGFTLLASGIAQVSNQGIDNAGQALVDVVTTNGSAYEYHDGTGFTFLASGVKSAQAGQGVSYVLLTSGALYEYQDGTDLAAGGFRYLTSGVSSIDAGTDKTGVNMVDLVYSSGKAYEDSDSTGLHYLAAGVQSVSAGQQGYSALVFTNGSASLYNETSHSLASLASSGVSEVTVGVDKSGKYMLDLVYSNGNAYEYHTATGWTSLGSGIATVGKARAGLVDIVFSTGDADEHTAAGALKYLTNNVFEAV
jgi:hypothetical protein